MILQKWQKKHNFCFSEIFFFCGFDSYVLCLSATEMCRLLWVHIYVSYLVMLRLNSIHFSPSICIIIYKNYTKLHSLLNSV